MQIEINASELTAFAEKLKAAAGEPLKKELKEFTTAAATDFLRVVQDELLSRIKHPETATGLLINSLSKGGEENIWRESDGGLTLEVGTNVKYAQWVEQGHHTNPPGVAFRWVPGEFRGGGFEYIPGAKTGMGLKAKWVEGLHFFAAAERIFERMFGKFAEAAIEKWMRKYLE